MKSTNLVDFLFKHKYSNNNKFKIWILKDIQFLMKVRSQKM